MEEAWVQDPLPVVEYLMLVAYLGSVTLLIGAVVFAAICYKKLKGKLAALRMMVYSIARLLVSFALSIFVWVCWPFEFDVMFGFLLLPAVVSEAVTITASYFLMKIKRKNK